jgi:Ca2+-binding EF-hand superfamily protein
MADEANEAALLERRQEIRTSLKAVENSLKEAGAVTDGYSSAYLLESAARADLKPSCGLFCRQIVHASAESLARSAASRFAFDAPDPVRYRWRLSPLGEVKCRRVWSLFDADGDEMWTHAEFLEYMAALGGSRASEQLEGFERSGEVWRMYMSDVCELDDQGRLTFEGFVTYREMVEDERPLARDLVKLGIALEWEELERLKIVKRLFDEYVDDPTGNVTAQVAQYLLADIGFVLTREETVKIIERRYQFARCLRFIHQLKRTLRLFGYRQKSALRFSNEGLARAADSDEQPRICKAGLLSLVFSSWCPARKTVRGFLTAWSVVSTVQYSERRFVG